MKVPALFFGAGTFGGKGPLFSAWGNSNDAEARRLGTDYLDLMQLHAFDAFTPIEEVLSTLATLVSGGKIRYVGVSNFAGWQLMKSLAAAERDGYPRYVAHQVYYSLVGRDYEWELVPLGLDQGVGTLVWSPLGWGRLTGKIRRGHLPDMPEEGALTLAHRLLGRIRALEIASVNHSQPSATILPSAVPAVAHRHGQTRGDRQFVESTCHSTLESLV